jgi:hypothetical protein
VTDRFDPKTTTVCCCANPVCLEKGCQLQAYQTFPSVSVKYVPVAVPDERKAIVAYLRERANAPHPIEAGKRLLSPAGRGLLLLVADRIETGDHLKVEEAS